MTRALLLSLLLVGPVSADTTKTYSTTSPTFSGGLSTSDCVTLENAETVCNDPNGTIQFNAPATFGTTGNERVTFVTSADYIDGTTDDFIKFVGVSGSDNTDLQVDLDDVGPVLSSSTDTSVIFSDAIQAGLAGTDGQLIIYNELGATDHTITINPSASQGAAITYTLPPTDGGASEFLQTNGSGTLVWAAVSGVTESAGDITAVGDATSGAAFGSGGSGHTLTLNSGHLTLTAAGGSNNESVKLDLEATANTLTGSSATGVTTMTLPWTWKMENGETIDNATNGKIALAGVGGTNNENLILDFETTANRIALSSTTGAADLTWGATTLGTASGSATVTIAGTFEGTGLTLTKTNTSTNSTTGASITATKSGTDATTTRGVLSTATVSAASGTQTLAEGIKGRVTKSGNSTLTTAYGVLAEKATVTAGTVTNNYALGVDGLQRHVVDADTIADSGGGGAAAATLTPTSSVVQLTCSDTDGCDITMGETGILDGTIVRITNLSANACNFADTSGVSELTGAIALGQYDSLMLTYHSDRWVMDATSNN